MLFKVLSILYMFLKDTIFKTTYYIKQHIIFNNIFYHTIYMAYTTYMFNNINICIDNIYMLSNLIWYIHIVDIEQCICDH